MYKNYASKTLRENHLRAHQGTCYKETRHDEKNLSLIHISLFFFLSILEDTGYMARVAFVMDKLLRKVGLSGRSIVPMLVGFGCSVPARCV